MTGRPIPLPDDLSGPFWESVNSERLSVQRCLQCSRYHHPPVEFCRECSSTELDFEPVSGRGRIVGYSETASGTRHPYFAEQTPYLIGIVELDEQPGLLMLSNFPGSELSELTAGAEVEVVFEDLGDGRRLPQFRVAPAGADG